MTEFGPQEGPQTAFAECMADIAIYGGAAGGGKAVSPDTPVITPTGSTAIKNLKVGSKVMNPDGGYCRVTGVYPQGEVYLYDVEFSDGTIITACKDHLWTVCGKHKNQGRIVDMANSGHNPLDPLALIHPGSQVVKTLDLIDWIAKGKAPAVPVNRPLSTITTLLDTERVINTYAAGAVILRPRLEPLRMWKYVSTLPDDYKEEGSTTNKFCREHGLMEVPLCERRIPEYIMKSDIPERLLFAQGLLDRQGKPETSKGRVYINFPQEGPLLDDIMELMRSLGCICRIFNTKTLTQLKIIVSPFIDPFLKNDSNIAKFKPLKASLVKTIKSVTPKGLGHAICIAVDHPNRLFMVNNYTVTHNTYGLLLEPLKWLDVPNFRTVIFRRLGTEITQSGGLWDESVQIYTEFEGKPIKNLKKWDWSNGCKVEMLHLEHETTLEERKGVQAPLIMFDELSSFTERMFFYMMSRNRSSTGIPAYIRATTNPVPRTDPTGGWIRSLIDWWLDESGYAIPSRSGVIRWFWRYNGIVHWGDSRQELIDKHAPVYGEDVVLPKSFTFISATVDDNKFMDPSYKAGLAQGNRADREALLEGCWDVQIDAGTYFKREWTPLYQTIKEPVSWCRYWDRAATVPNEANPDPDYTVGVLMGRGQNSKKLYIDDVVRFRLGPFEGRQAIYDQAVEDTKRLGSHKICIEKDPGAAGKIEAKAMTTFMAEFEIYSRPTGNKDKLTRFKPFSASAQGGDIMVREAPWNQAYFSELEIFTGNGKGHDDQADGTSGAYAEFIDPILQLGKIEIPEFRK